MGSTLDRVFDTDSVTQGERHDVPSPAGGASSASGTSGARTVAKEVGGMLAENAEAKAELSKHHAVDRIDRVVGALERFAGELNEADEHWLGEQAGAAATGVQSVARKLRQTQFRDLADDARRWSEHPVVFLGGAFALGIAMGRFVKSSSRSNGKVAGTSRTDTDEPERRSPRGGDSNG